MDLEAKAAINGLAITNANYPNAIMILKERFGDSQKIIRAHMRGLYSTSAPTETTKSLREYIDKIDMHIRALEALDKLPGSYGALLVPIMMDKIHKTLKENLIRKHGALDFTLDELRDGIKLEVKIMEEVGEDE